MNEDKYYEESGKIVVSLLIGHIEERATPTTKEIVEIRYILNEKDELFTKEIPISFTEFSTLEQNAFGANLNYCLPPEPQESTKLVEFIYHTYLLDKWSYEDFPENIRLVRVTEGLGHELTFYAEDRQNIKIMRKLN